MAKSRKPGPENSHYKMWVAMRDGSKVVRYSFPIHDHRGANEQFVYMNDSVLIKECKNDYIEAQFIDIRTNTVLKKVSPDAAIVLDNSPRYQFYVRTYEVGTNAKGYSNCNKRFDSFPAENHKPMIEMLEIFKRRILQNKYKNHYKYAELKDLQTGDIIQIKTNTNR